MVTKETEQKMMEELAEFVFIFGEKYGVLLDVKVKSRKHRKDSTDNDGDK